MRRGCDRVRFGSPLLELPDRKSTRLNSSHLVISHAVFCLKERRPQRQSTSGRRSDITMIFGGWRRMPARRTPSPPMLFAGKLFVMLFFFFFNDTATTEIYTLSLHDALPIFAPIHDVVEQNAGRLAH